MADRYDLLTGRKSSNSQDDKMYYTKIGVMFKSKEKDGFLIKLTALPLSIVDGEATIFASVPQEPKQPRSNDAYASQRRTPPVQTGKSETLDDDIPF
jgi:hypothetical protein